MCVIVYLKGKTIDMHRKKIVIIGGGPAGYIAAVRAAQSGAETHLVEMSQLGGTCLNTGCVPTKTLLGIGEFYRKAKLAVVPGVKSLAELDWPSALAHKNAIVKRLADGVSWLLNKNGVHIHNGRAILLPGLRVQTGDKILDSDAVILAVGSTDSGLEFPGFDNEGVIDSAEALSLREPPDSILIVGGGVVGMEFATLYTCLGSQVTVVEMLPEILPDTDAEIARSLREKLQADGIRFYVGAKLSKVVKTENALDAYIIINGQQEKHSADKVLLAVGRKPNISGLGLESLGVRTNHGAIAVDENFMTNIPGLYAVGDCNAVMMLAHAAMGQGAAAVGHIFDGMQYYKHTHIPVCIYTSPEIASVGMTEQQLIEKGIPYVVGRFDLSGNSKAVIAGESGFIKIITGNEFGEILGVHMIGPGVTEIIAQAALCMNMEGTADDLANTIHAHPTVSESMGEVAMAVTNVQAPGCDRPRGATGPGVRQAPECDRPRGATGPG